MKKYTTLWLGGVQADTDDSTLILLNYTQGELTDPTVVKNTYSQQVKLPMTATNNQIFSQYRRSDWAYSNAFNPLRRLPFEIRNSVGEVSESGYAKLDEVNGGYYVLTLFGGLGSFLWSYKYKSDGEEMTLADIVYSNGGEEYEVKGYIQPTAQMVKTAWSALLNSSGGVFNIINFAPTLNGFPDDFDANKAIFDGLGSTLDWSNLNGRSIPGYLPKQEWNQLSLLEMAQDHNEWEMMDFRADRQRQVLSLRAFLTALGLASNTDYTFTVSNDFMQSPVVQTAWIVLPWQDAEQEKCPMELAKSPTDYLLAVIKMFGLRLVCSGKTVRLMTNSEFFTQSIKDWGDRVDLSEVKSVPSISDTRYFNIAVEEMGRYTEDYEKRIGRPYGNQKVDTGSDFNADTTDLLDGIEFKGVADVLPTSWDYFFKGANFPIGLQEECTFKVFNSSGEEQTVTVGEATSGAAQWWGDVDGDLFTVLAELCDSGDKPLDAEGALLLFTGAVALPQRPDSLQVTTNPWHISDTTPIMLTINDGKPCWDIRWTEDANHKPVTAIPLFRRTNILALKTLEVGMPLEVATGEDISDVKTIYDEWWSRLVADRYDVNTRAVTLKVNLAGVTVSADLLRDFYLFGGALWSLNKIVNYDAQEDYATECEFVKIQDVNNYKMAQTTEGYIKIDKAFLVVDGGGGTRTVTITSNRTWVVSGDLTLSPMSGGVHGVDISVGVTITLGSTSEDREYDCYFTDSDGRIVSLHVKQVATPPPTTERVYIDADECISCGSCLSSCPVGAISRMTVDPYVAVIDEDVCVLCLNCLNTCPVGAIKHEY